mmetsp:Transcript_133283/g.231194  ORF Transcript_133283/g.231194 Transcript_133283/m.231194 type:complete len:101 (-) Transcript_133283:1706-2008(-)
MRDRNGMQQRTPRSKRQKAETSNGGCTSGSKNRKQGEPNQRGMLRERRERERSRAWHARLRIMEMGGETIQVERVEREPVSAVWKSGAQAITAGFGFRVL